MRIGAKQAESNKKREIKWKNKNKEFEIEIKEAAIHVDELWLSNLHIQLQRHSWIIHDRKPSLIGPLRMFGIYVYAHAKSGQID